MPSDPVLSVGGGVPENEIVTSALVAVNLSAFLGPTLV